MPPGVQSCNSCGASLAVPPTVVASTQPVAAPSQSGNNALKIVLIVLAAVVGVGILGVAGVTYMVWHVAHSVVHVSGSGDKVTFKTPEGTLTANTNENFTAADLGTDIYPGATTGKGSMRMSLPTGSMVTAVLLTSDPKDQVAAFYKSKFGSDASTFDSGNATVITLNKSKQESIVMTISKGESENQGKTQITIVHTTSNKPS